MPEAPPFAIKEWKDGPNGGTPITADALKDLERRFPEWVDLKFTDEIAAVDNDPDFASNSSEKVPSTAAARTAAKRIRLPGLVMPDYLATPAVTNGAIGVVEKTAYFCRCTVPAGGTLHDHYVWVGAKSGKVIGGVYDTGGAVPGKISLLAHYEVEPAANGWVKLGDPALAGMFRGQQINLAFVPNNSAITIGRGSAGAAASGSGKLPANFIPGEGAEPKLLATRVVGAFELPATIEEANLATAGDVPYVQIARVA